KLTQLEQQHRKSDLVSFVERCHQTVDQSQVRVVLDRHCPNWTFGVGQRLVLLAKCCIEQRKKNRPTMSEVCKHTPFFWLAVPKEVFFAGLGSVETFSK